MMVGLRNVWQANAAVLAGKWPRNDLMFHEVAGKRLGMIGFGGIGRAVAQRARALELDLCGYDPAIPPNAPVWSEFGTACVDLDTLFRTSDIISLHVPLTDGTRNLIDANSISRMKPTAFIINSSRGGIIDEAALAAALKAGKLGGAALDVFDEEPLRKGSVFDGVPSLLLTPHIAGVTREANARVSLVTVRNVRKALGASQ
jgi:(S)-sulfolactate dehydrogenase